RPVTRSLRWPWPPPTRTGPVSPRSSRPTASCAVTGSPPTCSTWTSSSAADPASPAHATASRGSAEGRDDGLDEVGAGLGVGVTEGVVEVLGRLDAAGRDAEAGAEPGEIQVRAGQVEHPRGALDGRARAGPGQLQPQHG